MHNFFLCIFSDSIQLVCDTMKRQIISRAFYGWLAYCRHLTTVRTHLSGLVNQRIVAQDDPCDASEGLTRDKWDQMNVDGIITDKAEVFRLTYYGGVCHEIRKQVTLKGLFVECMKFILLQMKVN
jgi:hypothetical protein